MSALVLLLIPLGLLLFVRSNPQRRRVLAQQALLKDLGPGDRVVTAGGMIGTLVAIEGEQAAVELAPGVIVEFLAPAILRRAPEPGQDEGEAAVDQGAVVPDDLSGLAHPGMPDADGPAATSEEG